MTLKQIADAIKQNTAALNEQRIDFDAFKAENRRLWDLVAQGELRIHGSECSRRHDSVIRYLGI